ncbi:MAG: DNA mismatch repair endonuclease MutL [Planctomycetaceae bacterium]|nr:DNA mismatch repair endonuclease MutL [Phycisphaerales bacterium]MCE2653342.1 DNA mismatch repair endonuclease MutL [Planctomycetaceae bacterium]
MADTDRRPIRVMPPLLANQIAAGEVVERAASVVKELVENSLDAGATRITVELEHGGIELVRISDDGVGIPEAELALALAAHATSKLTSVEDLDRVGTMGFRGEALASITSVSRITIRSRTAQQPAAAEIAAEGDVLQPVRPASGPVGTSVTVRNLFFNTPARRKFLKTPATEQGRCLDVVRELALAHAHVGFKAITDGKVVLDLPPRHDPRQRCLAVLGEELESELLEVHADAIDTANLLTLWGLIGKPSLARATGAAMHLFVNGRAVRDRVMQHAVREAFRGLIEPGRWPTAVLMIDIDPARVDVNVHPAKAEVRFRDSSAVHQALFRSVKKALQLADLTPTLGAPGGTGFGGGPSSVFGARGILPAASPPRFGAPPAGLSASSSDSPTQAAAPRVISAQAFADYFRAAAADPGQGRLSFSGIRAAVSDIPLPSTAPTGPLTAPPAAGTPLLPSAASPPLLADLAPVSGALQIHNAFLITQDEHGVVIIDQHALHERVMFEKLLARVSRAALESQPLLTPVIVKADARQIEALDGLRDLFARIGITAEQFSPQAVAIRAFPTFLFERNVEPGGFLSELLEKAAAEQLGVNPAVNPNLGPANADQATTEEALRDVLDMMACKAAVKAGDRLTDLELAELLAMRESIERASNCPHGRPTSIRLTIRDLERLFGRG